MVVTYYIKLFQKGENRHNGILMSLLHLVVETICYNTPNSNLPLKIANKFTLYFKIWKIFFPSLIPRPSKIYFTFSEVFLFLSWNFRGTKMILGILGILHKLQPRVHGNNKNIFPLK